MFVLLNKEDKVKKPACLIILESIEAYVNEVIKIHSYELIQAGEAAEWPVLNILIIAFIEALKRSEIPKDLHDEIMGRVGKAVVSIPEGVSLNSMREGLRGLRSHLQLQHICPQCGKTSETEFNLQVQH